MKLANNLNLPIEAVTEKLAFLGRTGSGKTYAAQRLAELIYEAGAQFVALDPVGKWWSLRLAANGKDQGIPLPVFGGLQGDIPLEPSGGALVADVIVDRNLSAVVDVSQFESDSDKARFAMDFGARLFFRKKASPSAVHIFVEESQEFVPQNTMKGEEKMLHVWTRIQKLGRNFGIGTSLLSQRPQEVNKKVLNQTELLFVFQLTGPQEREAIADWIEEKGIDEDIAAELPKLERGSPHAWSPAWLRVSKVVTITPKWTYDASSTPKVGAKRAPVKELSPIDLAKLQTDMAATIERAKADDPKLLRQQIAELKKQLSGKAPATADPASIDRAVSSAVSARDREWKATIASHERVIGDFKGRLGKIASLAHVNGEAVIPPLPARDSRAMREPPPLPKVITKQVIEKPRPTPKTVYATGKQDSDLGKAERAILSAIYWLRGEAITPAKVGFYADYTAGSGSFNNALGRLRSAGLLQGWQITPEGEAAAAIAGEKPSGGNLRVWLRRKLGRAENALLDALCAAHPQRLTADQLAEASGYTAGSGSFNNALGKLRSIEAAEGYERDGGTKAADVFFE